MSQEPTIIPAPAALQHHHVGHNHVPDASTVTAMASAALHSRMSLPSLAVHPPGTYSHPQSPLLSSPDSPRTEDRVLHSSNSTPVVPLSAGSYRRTTAPIILEHSPAGSKRTASGTLKNFGTRAPSPGAAAAPPPSTPRAQRQKIDDRPAASPRNVSQLSSQLRTRLTYALLKVRNDWTSESLEQIETRIRQGQTPSSPSSPASPRVRIKREDSEDGVRGEGYHPYDRRHQRTASEPGAPAHPLSHSAIPGEDAGRTYEAFWREHEPNPITKKVLQAKAASQALGTTTIHTPPSSYESHTRGNLQPPAQIIPDRDRRTHYNSNRHIPSLYYSASTQSNTSTVSFIPNTPPHSTQASDTQRTMEQDAVESLMFLSSPGNSQHMSQRNNSISQTMSEASSQTLTQLSEASHGQQSPAQSSQGRYSYGRNATTWPRSRHGFKQARTSLGQIGMMDSGVGFDAELTDEEPEPEEDNYLKPPSSQQYVK